MQKLLSVLLVLVMTLGILPTFALADGAWQRPNEDPYVAEPAWVEANEKYQFRGLVQKDTGTVYIRLTEDLKYNIDYNNDDFHPDENLHLPEDRTVHLDLNGHKINLPNFRVEGTLVVYDTKGGGMINSEPRLDSCEYNPVTFFHDMFDNGGYKNYTMVVAPTGTLILNGGTIGGGNSYKYWYTRADTDDGFWPYGYTGWVYGQGINYGLYNDGTVIVNGGMIRGRGNNDKLTGRAVYNDGTMIINDGTIQGRGGGNVINGGDDLILNGGTYEVKSLDKAMTKYSENNGVFVNAGTVYVADVKGYLPSESWMNSVKAEGSVLEQPKDKRMEIVPKMEGEYAPERVAFAYSGGNPDGMEWPLGASEKILVTGAPYFPGAEYLNQDYNDKTRYAREFHWTLKQDGKQVGRYFVKQNDSLNLTSLPSLTGAELEAGKTYTLRCEVREGLRSKHNYDVSCWNEFSFTVKEREEVMDVSVSVAVPEAGATPDLTGSIDQTDLTLSNVAWYDATNGKNMTADDLFQAGCTYDLTFQVETNPQKFFGDYIKDYVAYNGTEYLNSEDVTISADQSKIFCKKTIALPDPDISRVDIVVPVPQGGDKAYDETKFRTKDPDAPYIVTEVQWENENGEALGPDGTFVTGKTYKLTAVVYTNTDDYHFTDPCTGAINNIPDTVPDRKAKNCVHLTATMTALETRGSVDKVAVKFPAQGIGCFPDPDEVVQLVNGEDAARYSIWDIQWKQNFPKDLVDPKPSTDPADWGGVGHFQQTYYNKILVTFAVEPGYWFADSTELEGVFRETHLDDSIGTEHEVVLVDRDDGRGTVTFEMLLKLDDRRIPYTVEHKLQSLDNPTVYERKDTDTLKGNVGFMTEAVRKDYEGFTCTFAYEDQVLLEGPGTVVEMKYDRNTYNLVWDLGEGAAVGQYTVGDVRYGAPITAPEPFRMGYKFTGWDVTVPDTMPARNLTLTAQWAEGSGKDKQMIEIDLGTAYPPQPAEGEEVKLSADIPDDLQFKLWETTDPNVELADPTNPETSFTMTEGTVTVKPVYTATVTFQVVNGTWKDGTTEDKVVEVEVRDGKGTLNEADVPTGMKAGKSGFVGRWNTEPDTEDGAITGNALYTYTFEAPAPVIPAPTPEETPAEAPGFADVQQDDYFSDAVEWAVENGITTGMDARHFAPHASCTRAQAVTFLWRAAGEPEAKTENNPFTDVKKTDYFYEAVQWAVEEGITKGTSQTTFSPDQTCTRAQIVTFLWRAEGEPQAAGKTFADVSTDDYYAEAVRWAVAEEITTGTSQTTFSPNETCTRAQIVTFLYRAR